MKEQNLPINYPYKMTMRTTATPFFGKIHFFLILLLLAACSQSLEDNGSIPTPLFTQPRVIEANPEGGYTVNFVTGDTIKPLINSFGDTVLTGVPIPAIGKVIHPDNVAKPRVVKAPSIESLEKHNAHPNRHKIPENIPTFPVYHSQIKAVKFGEGNQDFVLVNSTGDTIPTGIAIPAKGKIVKTKYPKPTKALPPAFKDAAIANLQYLDVDQGLASSYVNSILEDRSGNMWFCTQRGGVSKYNGETFEHFTEKEGLSNNMVWTILEDKKGNLWFGTLGGGVSRYDGETFSHFTEKEGLSNNNVWDIIEDKHGNLWFGTEGGGVSKYDGETFSHFTEKEGLSNNNVWAIIEDKKGNLWFGTGGGGVSKYDGETFSHFTEKEGLSSNYVYTIIEDKHGNLWFGTYRGGVSKYDGATFSHFNEKEGLSYHTVISIVEDKHGNLWFGTEGGGVSKYDGATFSHFTEKEGLSNNRVSSIIEDKNGNLWFSTQGGGVSKYGGETFSHFTGIKGLILNTVISIIEDKHGNLWFGTWGGGVSKYDGETFSHFTEKEGLSNNFIYSIIEDKNGNLWFGNWGGGVSKYDGKAFSHFTEKEGLSNNYVISILEDKNGNLWFGTRGGGVTRYDGETFSHFTEKEGLSNNRVRLILEDKIGNLWFGTRGGGVSKYDGETFSHFTEKEGLSNNMVNSITEDKNGNLWFGTWGGGVSKYDGVTFSHFTEKEGLSNNIVFSIIEDKNGNVFMGTEKGLTSFTLVDGDIEKITFSINVFTKQDGLKGEDFSSAFIDSKSRAWWGSGKGLTMLDLNKFKISTQIPKPFLKQLNINEQFIDYRNISESPDNYREDNQITFTGVQKFENYPLNLELPFDKNHLTFHFAAIDWAAPHKIRYSYRMLGLDDNWNVPSKEAKADYRNLPHGTFTFQIRAIGESGEWSEPFDYTFTINPPWWHTWWAYLAYTFLFLLALRIFSTWRQKNLIAEKEKLEQTVEERTLELKLSQSQLIQSEKMASLGELTAGIAHEIKNPLNFVNNFSEVSLELLQEVMEEVKAQGLAPQQTITEILKDIESNLRKIYDHGSRADGIVTSMLQHSRTSSGQKELTNINALADEYLRLSYHGLRAKDKSFNADFKTDFDPSLPKVNVIPQDIGRVLLNLINNAFYAVKTQGLASPPQLEYKPTVTVSTKNLGDQIEISVIDNGNGIPVHIKDKIFQPFFTTKPTGQGTGLGLSLSYDIVKAHGGELKVESQEGVGTSFIIKLPKYS
jgi:signal transduction histidine kinase/ligand-binding sensor domain-containing protein